MKNSLCFILLFLLLWGCTKKNDFKTGKPDLKTIMFPIDTTTVPDTGMYVQQQFSLAQLTSYTEVIYSCRHNRNTEGSAQYDQYTSTKGNNKALDRASDSLYLRMDIVVPPNATGLHKQPLIVFIHGGGFTTGDKDAWKQEGLTYARAGYVVATINYRLTVYHEGITPDSIRRLSYIWALEDAQNAIRFLKANSSTYHIDTSRVAVMGGSAGGVLTLMNAIEYDAENDGRVVSDFPGITSKCHAAISTGGVLVDTLDPGFDPTFLHYNAYDSPVLMFNAKEYDSGQGNHTWSGNAVPTKQLINNSGNECYLVPQPNMTHTVNLGLDTDYFTNYIRFFLWEKLNLEDLL